MTPAVGSFPPEREVESHKLEAEQRLKPEMACWSANKQEHSARAMTSPEERPHVWRGDAAGSEALLQAFQLEGFWVAPTSQAQPNCP